MKKIKIGLMATIALLLSMPVAFAASSSYFAKTTVYFNIPSDASYSIAMPADYSSWTQITGENEGSATTTDWISFNFTNVPQATLQEPYQLGAAGDAQSGVTQPIFYIDNTGNVDEKFEVKLDTAAPTGVGFYFNATGGTTPTTDLTEMTTGYQQVTDVLTNTQFLNLTLYANTSSSATAGVSSKDIYIKSTAV